jgi:hypothetical protein
MAKKEQPKIGVTARGGFYRIPQIVDSVSITRGDGSIGWTPPKIDMEKRFAPGGTNDQVNDMVKRAVEDLDKPNHAPPLDIVEMAVKSVRLGSFTRNRPTSIGDEHGSRDRFGNLLLDPNRKEAEDDSIHFPTVGLGVDFFVNPELQACIDEHHKAIKPADKEPPLLDLSRGKRYLNPVWFDWCVSSYQVSHEEALRIGTGRMVDQEFNEKMRSNVEILPHDPADPLLVKIKYHDRKGGEQ